MATKKYLSLERLTEYDELIKGVVSEGDTNTLTSAKSYTDAEVAKKANATHSHDDLYYTESEVDSKLSAINATITNITDGLTPVKEAEHANSADSATDADKLGGQLPSYYAKASDIPTGALADKDTVSESDLDSALAEKVNAAAEGNHSHSNKSVLDGITESKVSAWDSSLSSANTYTDEKVANLLNNSTEAVDSIMELAEAMENNADAIEALEKIAAGKANAEHTHVIANVTGLQSALDNKVEQTVLDDHVSDAVKHITATERTNWNVAKTHADSAHAPSNAQENVIESIKVNGTAQAIASKAVNITVPTKTSDLTHDSGFLVASDIANKADKATTLAGYGITDAYTKTEVDAKTVVDSTLSSSSTNPVQNKVINSAFVSLTSTVSSNTSSISSNTSAISSLQTAIGEIQEITSEDISDLFA